MTIQIVGPARPNSVARGLKKGDTFQALGKDILVVVDESVGQSTLSCYNFNTRALQQVSPNCAVIPIKITLKWELA